MDGDGRGEHASTVSRGGRGVKGGGGGWVVDFNRLATGRVYSSGRVNYLIIDTLEKSE